MDASGLSLSRGPPAAHPPIDGRCRTGRLLVKWPNHTCPRRNVPYEPMTAVAIWPKHRKAASNALGGWTRAPDHSPVTRPRRSVGPARFVTYYGRVVGGPGRAHRNRQVRMVNVMRLSRQFLIVPLVAVALVSLGAPPDTASAQQAVTIQLSPQNSSGITGTATLTPMGDQTRVVLTLAGAGAGPEPAHIHAGTCAD